MLWIALYIPELSLQIAARGMAHEQAMVIKDGPANHPIVIAANERALTLGIQLGMPIGGNRTFNAICHGLRRLINQIVSVGDYFSIR